MISHTSLGASAFTRSKQLKILIDKREIVFAGNSKLKIYGTLTCASGKRMKAENRVFFNSITEAVELGYRPCGHCVAQEYKRWKSGLNKI